MRQAVICFTRVPRPGRTKTRLMPFLRGEECAALHTAFLRDIAAVCDGVEAELFVSYAPDEGWELLREIFPTASFFPQEGEDLGARMRHALERVLSLGYDACVLIGSDLPELTAAHLQSGFAALAQADVVLGPTPDGGYYLVGLKAPCPALFAGQTYGTGSVYENAVAAAHSAGRSVAAALPCADVDTPEDLRKLREALRATDSHTARCLDTLFSREGRT